MALVQNRYLFFESSSVVGDSTFYVFRVVLVGDVGQLLYKLLGVSGPLALTALDVPILVPSQIDAGEQFSVYNGSGEWSAPEDMYFLYVKGFPHVHGVYPVAPGEESVVLSQALMDRPQVIYSSTLPPDVSDFPPGDSPEETEPEVSGWAFPPYLLFGYQEKGVATRYLSPWFYTDVVIDKLWVWGGCDDYAEDEDHVLNNFPPDLLSQNLIMRWNTPHFIYNCHEEDSGFSYWIVRTVQSTVEHLSVWMFESSQPAYYYPYLAPALPPKTLPLPVLLWPDVTGIGIHLTGFASSYLTLVPVGASLWLRGPRIRGSSKYQFVGLSSNGYGISSAGKGIGCNV